MNIITQLPEYTLIDTTKALEDFYQINKDIKWLGFDTEFIGEKRFHTLLCLIQVVTEHGNYLIDTLAVDDIQPFLRLLIDENILKITHAGDNDYRLLYKQYGVLPKNVFDTQIAYGLVSNKYPLSFGKLLKNVLNIIIGKSMAVTDWQKRPLSSKQLLYALNDVIYLQKLYEELSHLANNFGRYDWILDECSKLYEKEENYTLDPDKDTLSSGFILNSNRREKLFILRLFRWRSYQAEKKNYSKEMILPKKLISPIANAISGGSNSFNGSRRIPTYVKEKYSQLFLGMYLKDGTVEELDVLKKLPKKSTEDEETNIITEMLYLIVYSMCIKNEIAIGLVMPRGILKEMKQDPYYLNKKWLEGWRSQFFTPRLIFWFENRHRLQMGFENDNFTINLIDN